MNTLIHADIFFFITTIAVILLVILLIILLAYAIKIVRTISSIAETVKTESENVVEDIAELRGKVKEEGVKVSAFWRFVTGFFLNRFTEKFTSHQGGNSGRKSHTDKTRSKKNTKDDEVVG